jgi:hypothetical protein
LNVYGNPILFLSQRVDAGPMKMRRQFVVTDPAEPIGGPINHY